MTKITLFGQIIQKLDRLLFKEQVKAHDTKYWKDSPEDLITLVEEWTENHANQQEINRTLSNLEPLLNDDIEDFLPTLNRAIEKHDIQLVWLDIDSDSYPLALLNLHDVPTAKEYTKKNRIGCHKKLNLPFETSFIPLENQN